MPNIIRAQGLGDARSISPITRLTRQPADPLLSLIGAYRADARADKIDLGVGVFRDDAGVTPILRAVKAAERLLVERQPSKSYLGPEGDIEFFERLVPLVIGQLNLPGGLVGLQTPGGTGALRLAAELIAACGASSRILVGNPTWPNHFPIFAAAKLEVVPYRYFDVAAQRVCLDEMMGALRAARSGDFVLLHGSCHNPTGADLDLSQWRDIAGLLAERGLIPLVDLAYQGLGGGVDEDAAGLRIVLENVPDALVTYSCDKNFGLYRERTGALIAIASSADSAAIVQSNLLSLARANWSMPPDHGAAIVRTILADEALTVDWRTELDAMRLRINTLRVRLGALDPSLGPLSSQRGMLSTLPLTPEQIRELRETFGVYMAGSGRINITGLNAESAVRFADALRAIRRPD